MDNKESIPTSVEPRPIHIIAREIRNDWGKQIYFGAVPYLHAMASLEDMNSIYHADTADSIVLYFLSNAQTWRGETARRVKAELRNMLKGKR